MHESLLATFERLRGIYGLELEPTRENLHRLQQKEIDLNGLESEVAKTVSPDLLNYHGSWESIDRMLEDVMSPEFRRLAPDSYGNGWAISWHCLDHVGFVENPRRRDMGFHNVYDHYREILERHKNKTDALHFHHHPLPFSKAAHRCATHYFSHAPIIFEILARRIIDRHWFPCVNRPGFHATRPDSHWFMEQFLPFDYANQSSGEDYSAQKDLSGGRFGDWRRAPKTWSPYHPAHDDYQRQGDCRRWIARCLNVGTRLRLITEQDIELAFEEATQGKPVILAITNHDFRDIRPDINRFREMLVKVSRRYPAIRYRYCEAREAMRRALGMPLTDQGFKLSLARNGNVLQVSSTTRTFGPQPFWAIKTRSGQYFHDNLDFQHPFREWTYTLDEHTCPVDSVSQVAVGACDEYGNVSVAVLNLESGALVSAIH